MLSGVVDMKILVVEDNEDSTIAVMRLGKW